MLEIERKFTALITKTVPAALDKYLRICQGYLVVTRTLEWRIRFTEYLLPAKGVRCHTALKLGNGLVRREWEIELPMWLGDWLGRCTRAYVFKTRIKADGWDVDVYHGALDGLVLAEVEFAHVDEPLPPVPSWLMLRTDVTACGRYANKRLAHLSIAEQRAIAGRIL